MELMPVVLMLLHISLASFILSREDVNFGDAFLAIIQIMFAFLCFQEVFLKNALR